MRGLRFAATFAACVSLGAVAALKSCPFTFETIKVADNVYAFDEPNLNALQTHPHPTLPLKGRA
jgi:hypothetical protein